MYHFRVEMEILNMRGVQMALINCPECEKQVSNEAKRCPNCGYPFSDKKTLFSRLDINLSKEKKGGKKAEKRNFNKKILIIFGILIVFLFALSFITFEVRLKNVSNGNKDIARKIVSEKHWSCLKEHEWIDATCVSVKHCKLCGIEVGELGGHLWTPATCENPKYCSLCKKTQGKALGHLRPKRAEYEKYLCTKGVSCTRCGKLLEEPYGHTTTVGYCNWCDEYIDTDLWILDEAVNEFGSVQKEMTELALAISGAAGGGKGSASYAFKIIKLNKTIYDAMTSAVNACNKSENLEDVAGALKKFRERFNTPGWNDINYIYDRQAPAYAIVEQKRLENMSSDLTVIQNTMNRHLR